MTADKKKIIIAVSVVLGFILILFVIFKLLVKNKASLPIPMQKSVEKVETIFNPPAGMTNLTKPTGIPSTQKNTVPSFPTVTPTPGVNTLYSIETKPTPIPTLKPPQPGIVVADDFLYIANSISNWLPQMRSNNGIYYFMSSCNDSNQCEADGTDNRASAPIIWARFKIYQKTHDQALLNEIEKDFTTYNNPQVVQLLQNDFWNCRFLYDLSQSTALTQIFKLHAKNLCERGQYFPTDVDELTQQLKSGSTPEADLTATQKGVKFNSKLSADDINFSRYSANSSDFSAKYLWFKNPDDLAFAKMFFTKAALSYISLKNKKTDINEDRALFGIAAYDLYEASNSNSYLDFAKYITTEQNQYGCQSVMGCTNYSMLLNNLYTKTKDASYKTREQEMLTSLLNQGYDSSGFSGYKKGTGAIRSLNPGPYQFIAWQNGYVAGTLASFETK